MLLKALENEQLEKVNLLIRKGCDLKERDTEGFSAFDYIFAKNIESLKQSIKETIGKKKYDIIDQEYSENRLSELRRLISGENQEIMDIIEQYNKRDGNFFNIIESDSDLVFDDSIIEERNEPLESNIHENWLDGEDKTNICSEFFKSLDSFKSEHKNIEEEKESKSAHSILDFYQENTERLKKDIENSKAHISELEARKKELKEKLNKKKKEVNKTSVVNKSINQNCHYTKLAKMNIKNKNYMSVICKNITRENNNYVAWIDKFQKDSKGFFNGIYNTFQKQLLDYFKKNIKVSISGSIENNLHTPWSDLNIIVTILRSFTSDSQKTNYIIDNSKQFASTLKNNNNFIESYNIEERASLLILTLMLNKEFRCLRVEIIFKYSQNNNYLTHEHIISDYLQHYPVSRKLYLVFRTFLHHKRLDDPSLNGLKSIAIFLMIIAYIQKLQHHNMITKGNSVSTEKKFHKFLNHPKHVGQLFINFLFFYSYNFDFYRDCIFTSPVDEELDLPIFPKNSINKIYSLMIVNPYNKDIILTKSFKRTFELKQCLKLCYISIFQSCFCPSNRHMIISKHKKLKSKHDPEKLIKMNNLEKEQQKNFNYVLVRYNYFMGRITPKKSLNMGSEDFNLKLAKTVSRNSLFHQGMLSQGLIDDFAVNIIKQKKDQNSQDIVYQPLYSIYRIFNFNFTNPIIFN